MPHTPVPNEYNIDMSGVPGVGTSRRRDNTYQREARYTRALSELLPFYQQAMEGAQSSQAGTDYDLFAQYAPKYNEIGQQLTASNAAADRDLLNGTGKELVQSALDTAKLYDPEYFATRGRTADELSRLFSSIDLSGALSGSEREEISRSLAQQDMRRGTSGAPSNLDTVGNAVTFGSAGRNRQLQSQDQLTKAIAAATAFLPTSKSGVDTFQIATGKSSGPGLGTAALGTGQQGQGNGGNLFGGIQTTGNTYLQGSLAQDDNNFGSQFSGALASSLGQSIGQAGGSMLGGGMMAMMCWIAREVYGVDNPKWKMFRQYMETRAPQWFYNWYLKNGEKFAAWLHDKPFTKFLVRKTFDLILFTNYKGVYNYAS